MARKKPVPRRSTRNTDHTPIDWREVGKLLAVAIVVVAGIWLVRIIEGVPIKTIKIQSPLQNVNKQEVEKIAARYSQDGFFTARIDEFEQELNNISWVYQANIKRKWPYKLLVEIEEQQAVFRWGDEQLLNKNAQAFHKENAGSFEHLPMLLGVEGRELHLANFFYRYNKHFETMGASMVSLREDARYDKVIELSNRISINVGKEEVSRKIKQFLQTYNMLNKEQKAAVVGIDFRHRNGFAVRWNS